MRKILTNDDDVAEVSKSKAKKAQQKKKTVIKKEETYDFDENLDNDNDVDLDDVPEVATVKSKSKKPPQKKKKENAKKESEDELVEEVVRVSRGRRRKPVNYKKDSGESKKATKARKTVKGVPSNCTCNR